MKACPHLFPKQAILFSETKSPVSGDKVAVSGNKLPERKQNHLKRKQNRRLGKQVWTGVNATAWCTLSFSHVVKLWIEANKPGLG